MYGVIYKISNTKNDLVYIGITTRTIKQRFKEHCIKDSAIGNAIRSLGVDNFTIEQIDTADTSEELFSKESQYIKQYDSCKKGYNRTQGDWKSLPITVHINDKQQKFIEQIKRLNKKEIDVNNTQHMVSMVVTNLVLIYLECKYAIEKIKTSQMILRLTPFLLKQVLEWNVLTLDELKHYSCQSLSSFEEWCLSG